jgi:tetratricopeptide (TPR) repeat protein
MKISPSGKLNHPIYSKEETSHREHKAAKYWYDKGQRLMLSEKYAEAINAYCRAIDQNTGLAEAYFRRGACYYVLGHYRKAADDLNAASLLGCQDAQLWSKFETIGLGEDEAESEF